MRHYPFFLLSILSLVSVFFLTVPDTLANPPISNPLIYNNNPLTEDGAISVLEGISGAGSNPTSEKNAAGIALESYETGKSVEGRNTTFMGGGDYSTMSGSAANSTSLVRQHANYLFTGAMGNLHASIAMTDGTIHQGLVKAQEVSQREALGALTQEQNYLLSLGMAPDGERLVAAYSNCKKRILKDGFEDSIIEENRRRDSVSIFHAIKQCMGGYSETPPNPNAQDNQSSLSNADASKQVQLSDQENRPDPIYVEKRIRPDGYGNPADQARNHCKSAKYKDEKECFMRSLWDYVYHFVAKRSLPNVLRSEYNPDKWKWSDEKAFYFGNVIYTEFKRSDEEQNVNLPDELKSESEQIYQFIAPTKRWVNFWGPNGDSLNRSEIPPDYQIGTWSPLSGIELIRAPIFQDIYGGLYALSMKMCEHANAEIDLLSSQSYNAYNPRCELWDAPLDAQWTVENVTVPGLGVATLGCTVGSGFSSGPVFPPPPWWTARIFPPKNQTSGRDYEFLWPSRSQLENWGGFTPFANSDRVNWQPRRYYENWEALNEMPKIKTLLQHLELTQLEALMLKDILLYETPKDVATGRYQCNEILNGISYAEIMEFSDEKTATSDNDAEWWIDTHPQYKEPKSSAWPIRSKVKTPNIYGPVLSTPKDKEISKRIALFYNYANLLAQRRALPVVEQSLLSLSNQVSSYIYFPKEMKHAEILISSQLPGGTIGGSMTQRAILTNELITVKEMIRELHGELKSAARFSDKALSRQNLASGAAATP